MVKIFLIRHGESMQNTGENKKLMLPDHKIWLTEAGKEQAEKCGEFLENYCKENAIDLSNSTMFLSPYDRARETAKIINEHLHISDVKEDVMLIEHQYGLFDNVDDGDYEIKFPNEGAYYNRYYNNEGKFYAKFPQGESPLDVTIRARIFMETLFRDVNEGKENFFIVSHGTTIRAFLLSYFHYSPEWFAKEPNMINCSIRLIDKNGKLNKDMDYIYGGRKIKKQH